MSRPSIRGGVNTLTLHFRGEAFANSLETFYVALQDSAGRMKVVNHPDLGAIAAGAWLQWDIPLSQFSSAGVNLASIRKMIIGVDDRTSPSPGGEGNVYIDDIRLTQSAAP